MRDSIHKSSSELSNRHKGHHLVDEIIYGPVLSRRYGNSLGINILPNNHKYCNFNCVYCQLGWNQKLPEQIRFPKPKKIEANFINFIKTYNSTTQIDNIVISGNGEPTLHPDFADIVNSLIKIRDKYLPQTQISCLTNGTTIYDDDIFNCLSNLDECAIKFDANTQDVNLPESISQQLAMIQKIKVLPNLALQCCFFDGKVSNISTTNLNKWIHWLDRIHPKRLDLYTIDRTTPHKNIHPVSKEFLENLKKTIEEVNEFVKIRIIF